MHKLIASLIAGALVATVTLATAQIPFTNATAPPAAQGPPSGSVTLSGGAVAVGVGYVWGHGTLAFADKQYKFKLSGVSVVDVGAANIKATGDVYNLTGLQDFNGTYSALSAGATVAGGGSVVYLSNGKGVVIKLHSTTEGLRFNLSADGVRVKLQSQ